MLSFFLLLYFLPLEFLFYGFVLFLLFVVVLVRLPAGSIWIVPNKGIILVELTRFGEGFVVVSFVEHVGGQS